MKQAANDTGITRPGKACAACGGVKNWLPASAGMTGARTTRPLVPPQRLSNSRISSSSTRIWWTIWRLWVASSPASAPASFWRAPLMVKPCS